MTEELMDAICEQAERVLEGLDVDAMDAALAHRIAARFAQLERVGGSGRALLARKTGDVQTVARISGTSVAKARAVVGLSRTMQSAPALKDAVRAGSLSLDQATEIAKAESAAPGSAETLVEVAESAPFHVLREESRRAVLERSRADLGRRQRAARRARHSITDLGMVRIEAELEPHVGAPIVTRLETAARRRAKNSEGTWEQHLADAFAEVAAGESKGGKPEMVVLVSHDVAARGWTDVKESEHCDIVGVGPIDPAIARNIADDAFLSGVVFDGTDLRQIKRWTRTIPIEVRTALRLGEPPEFTGPKCVDCGNRLSLELDHVHPLAAGGATSVANLKPRCDLCHDKKTATDRRELATASRAPP